MDYKQTFSISGIDFTSICLLCRENDDNLLEIFGKHGIDLNIGAILQEHFWFEIDASDEKNICEKCWEKVQSFHTFYNFIKCVHQQQTTQETKAIVADGKEPIGLLLVIKDEPPVEPDIDIKDELDDFTDIPDTYNSPAAKFDELEEDNNSSTDSFTITNKTRKSELTWSTSLSAARSTSSSAATTKIKNDSSLISQYFNMSCDLCGALLYSYRDVKKHYKDVHDRKGYLKCCRKKFVRLADMLQHCQWHVNPDSFNCSYCSKNFCDKTRLHGHIKICHATEGDQRFGCNKCGKTFLRRPYLVTHLNKDCTKSLTSAENLVRKPGTKRGFVYKNLGSFKCSLCQKCFTDKVSLDDHICNVDSAEDQRQFECYICNNTFATSYALRSHMIANHVKEDAKKSECPICGKRLLHLELHINQVHHFDEGNLQICELCAKVFKSKQAYERHYIDVHTNISLKVQCDICGKWLKNKLGLKKHIGRHNSKPETCGICGRLYSNVENLKSHIQRTHSNVQASFKCSVCGKMLKTPKNLKEHMAIHENRSDLYTCTFCTKTFRSNANMYSHRKRAHPVELARKKAEEPPLR